VNNSNESQSALWEPSDIGRALGISAAGARAALARLGIAPDFQTMRGSRLYARATVDRVIGLRERRGLGAGIVL
jgi:hypothetical protein